MVVKMDLSVKIQAAIFKFKTYVLSIVYSKEEIDSLLDLKMDKTNLNLNMFLNTDGELTFVTTKDNIKSENINFDYNTGILEITTKEKEEGEYLYGYSFDYNLNSQNEFREHLYKTGIQGEDNKSFSFDFKISNTNRVKLVCFIDKDNQYYHPEGHWGLGKADEYGEWEILLDYPNINSNQWYHATIYRYNRKNIGLKIEGQLIQKTFSHSPYYDQFCLGAYGFSNEYVIIKNIQEGV